MEESSTTPEKRKHSVSGSGVYSKKMKQEGNFRRNLLQNLNTTSQDSSSTFKKRKGTTDRGKDYEHFMIADLILKLLSDKAIKNFRLSSNEEKFGAFDDIVLEIERHSNKEVYALQLKHRLNDSKTFPIDSLQGNGHLSIKKHFDSLKGVNISTSCKFILFTNLTFSGDDNSIFPLLSESLYVKISKCDPIPILNTCGKTGSCYKFEVTKSNTLSSEQLNVYKKFFANFFLYDDQPNFKQTRENIINKFQQIFCCNKQTYYERYIQFISEWSLREGTKEKLDKMQMQRVIALILLTPFSRPLSFQPVNDKMKLLQDAISEFHATIFKEEAYDDVKGLWGDAKSKLPDISEINKIITQYQLSSKSIPSVNDLSDEMTTTLLWLLDECPLVVIESEITYKAIELCQSGIFILLGTSLSKEHLQNVSIFQHLSDLDSKSETYENILRIFKCSIQNKGEVSLEFLKSQNKLFPAIVTTNNLVKMLHGAYLIGEKKETIPIPYINRRISVNLIDIKYLERVDKSTLIVLSCMNKIHKITNKLGNFNLNNVTIYLRQENVKSRSINYNSTNSSNHVPLFHTSPNLKNFVSGPDLYVSLNECSPEEFETICHKNNKMEKYHHFRIIDEESLEWIRTTGDISDLEPYRIDNKFIEETSLYCKEPENNINLVNGDPGMGKSELLKNIKNNSSAKFWIIFLYSHDITLLCTYLEGKSNHTNEFIKFIMDTQYNTYPDLDKNVIRMFIENNQVAYFWDALDEISTKNLHIITNLILELTKKSLFQWISSRCHLKQHLEKKFSVLSRNIGQFNETDQTLYIYQRLQNYYTEEDIEEVTNKIRSTITLMKHNDVLGVPLQIFMLTELFRQDQSKYFKLLNDVFSLKDLYHHIVEEKFNIYYQEKANIRTPNHALSLIMRGYKKTMFENYEKAALKALVTKEVIQHFNIKCDEFLNEIQDENDSIGLITEVTDNFPQFLHNSYAEYFVASYFLEHYNNVNERNKIDSILLDEKYANIRFFFDLLKAEGSSAHIAVLYENVDLLKQYDKDQLKNCQDQSGRNVLQLACSWGKVYPILSVEKKHKIYVIDNETDDSEIEETARYKEMLEYLLENCDDSESVKKALSWVETSDCLMAALMLMLWQKRRNNFISTLTDNKRDINILYYSVKFGYDEVLDLFENLPYIKTKKDDSSLFHLAVKYNQQNYLQNLLAKVDYNKFIDDRDKYGRTALHRACQIGNFSIVEQLVNCGTNINARTNEGCAPLHAAALHAHVKIVEYLLKSEAKLNIRKTHGITPLHVACWNGHGQVVKLLIDAGADINIAASDGCTPLYVASRNKHNKVLELLLSIDSINIDLPQKDSVTPLFVACQEGHEQNVELLIKFGANIHISTSSGESPLYVACQNGHKYIVEMLINARADVNVVAKNGWTSLHIACQQGYCDIVKLLIETGANINTDNFDGVKPLAVACSHGHKEIVQLLEPLPMS